MFHVTTLQLAQSLQRSMGGEISNNELERIWKEAVVLWFKSVYRHLAYFEGKGKVVSVHAIKAYRGSRGVLPLILNLGTKWRWVVIFTLRAIYFQERTLVPITWATDPVEAVLVNKISCLCWGSNPPTVVSRYSVSVIPAPFLPGGYQKALIRITGLWAEVWIQNLTNTKQKRVSFKMFVAKRYKLCRVAIEITVVSLVRRCYW